MREQLLITSPLRLSDESFLNVEVGLVSIKGANHRKTLNMKQMHLAEVCLLTGQMY